MSGGRDRLPWVRADIGDASPDIATLAVAVERRLQPAAMALLGFLGEVR
jgi:hypothetical protein